jgi:hypothetical protein
MLTVLGLIGAFMMFETTRTLVYFVLNFLVSLSVVILSSSLVWVIGYFIFTLSQRG